MNASKYISNASGALAAVVAAAGLVGFAGSTTMAQGVPGGLYVSGLLHNPMGSASVSSGGGRRVIACCITSSGQDGVAVRLNNVSGGSVGIDPGPLLAPGVLNVRHKGWDGTIKGSMSIARDLADDFDGNFDFSGLGATGVRAIVIGEDGLVVSDTTTAGAFRFVKFVASGAVCVGCGGSCPDGRAPKWWVRLVPIWPPRFENGNWITEEWSVFFGCSGSIYDNLRQIRVYPLLDNAPPLADFDSMEVSGTDLGPIELENTAVHFRKRADQHHWYRDQPIEVWGLGDARLEEQCDNPGGCDADTATLLVGNLASAGDGVAVGLGASAGGASVGLNKCCEHTCLCGHVTIMKAFDDNEAEMRITHTHVDPMNPALQELDADFSDIGASGFILELFGPGGTPLGTPGGTAIIGGGPRPIFGNNCPPGSREVWDNYGTPQNPVWVFAGCLGAYLDFHLPSGEVVTGVESYRVTPLGATSSYGPIARIERHDDGNEITLTDISVIRPYCAGDASGDGAVNFNDITSVLGNWGADYTPRFGPGDATRDGKVDFNDITAVLANWQSGCN